MKKSVPTHEYQFSRSLDSALVLEAILPLIKNPPREDVTTRDYLTKQTRTDSVIHTAALNLDLSLIYERLRFRYTVPFRFSDLLEFVHRELKLYKPWLNPRRRYRPCQDQRGLYFRKGPGFVQHGLQKKEEHFGDTFTVDHDQAARDWRRRKGFTRDRARRDGHFCKCCLNDARYRRRWERDLLRVGKYDKIYHHKSMFTSNWDCC